jgi:EpsI family protein
MDRSQAVRFVAVLLTVLGVTGARFWHADAPLPPEDVDLERIPLAFADYEGRELEVSERVLAQLRTDALLVREYVGSDELPVWLLIDYHRTQQAGSTVHSPRVCYPGTGWRVVHVSYEDAPEVPSRRLCWLELENEGYRRLATYWYESRWGDASDELSLKANVVRSAVARRPSDAAIVRVSAPIVNDDVDDARARIVRFLRLGEPHWRRELPFVPTS